MPLRHFIAAPPGTQSPETVRQFREIQTVLTELVNASQAETYEGTFTAQDITGTYEPITMTPELNVGGGRFFIMGMFDIRGVGGSGWLQFEASVPGLPPIDGEIWDADNNIDRAVTVGFYFDGPGLVSFKVRGQNVDLQGGRWVSNYIGITP